MLGSIKADLTDKIYTPEVSIKLDIINHHFMLEFVDSDLYFGQDKNNFINPLLQVGSGSSSLATCICSCLPSHGYVIVYIPLVQWGPLPSPSNVHLREYRLRTENFKWIHFCFLGFWHEAQNHPSIYNDPGT